MLFPKSRLLDVLLYNVRVIFVKNSWRFDSIYTRVSLSVLNWVLSILLRCVVILLCLQILFEFSLLSLKIFVNSFFQLIQRSSNKYTFALTTCFRFNDKHAGRVKQALLLSEKTVWDLFIPLFILPLVVLLNFVKVRRIEPCMRKKLVVVRKLLAESSQMNTKSIFPCDIVHPKKVINSLERLHVWKKVWLNAEILPPNLPLKFFWLELTRRNLSPLSFDFSRINYNIVVIWNVCWLFNLFRRYDDPVVELIYA